MVREINKEGKRYYICEACGFAYKEKEFAEKCEKWCRKHKACSIEITRHAVKI